MIRSWVVIAGACAGSPALPGPTPSSLSREEEVSPHPPSHPGKEDNAPAPHRLLSRPGKEARAMLPAIGGWGEGNCRDDAECGYDVTHEVCDTEGRFNRQPPMVDQGIVCFCEEGRCGVLRVRPVPCESDASCAVNPLPRPHPVAASAEHPHERGKVCRDYVISTTCERTNICTMHRHACPRVGR